TTTNSSTIAGFVASAVSPSGTLCTDPAVCDVTFTLLDSQGKPVNTHTQDSDPFAASPTTHPAAVGPTGYTLSAQNGLAPGLYRLTIGATGYLPATVNVRVPLNAVAQAPQVNLYPGNTISGTINTLGPVGDLATAGPNPPYTNCVWAIPVGSGIPTPTKCEFTPPVPSQCQSKGLPDIGHAEIGADNTYTIGSLCDGTYNVYVVVTNPWYVNPAPTASQTVTHGQTVTYSPHVMRKGHVVIALSRLSSVTGAVVAPGAITGSATCGGTSTGTFSSPPNATTVTVEGVDSGGGTVSCTVAASDGATALSGTVSGLSVGTDSDTPAHVTLTEHLANVYGQVVSAYGGGNANHVGGVTVTVTGTVGYDGANARTGSISVQTDTNGCFAITSAPNTDFNTNSTACGTIPARSTNQAAFSLATSVVSVSVAAGSGTSGVDVPNFSLTPSTLNSLRVKPVPIPVSGLNLTATNSVDLSAATITVTGRTAAGSGTVHVTADSGGLLSWTDANVAAGGEAWPGTYALSATLPGYKAATTTLTCTFATATCTMAAFQLQQLGTLSGNLLGYLGTDTSYPSQPLVGATVSAVKCDDSGATPVCPAGNAGALTATSNSSGDVQLVGASSLFVMQLGTWKVTISAPGYTAVSQQMTIGSGTNALPVDHLFTTPVDFSVGIQIGPTSRFACPDTTPTCASVTLYRVDTGQPFTVNTQVAATHRYLFAALNPATYIVTIVGDGLTQTSTQYTVPLGSTQPFDVPVPVIQNNVSGIVNVPTGKNASPTALNDVPVALGHLDGGGAFVVDTGTDNGALITKTTTNAAGLAGAFSFPMVRNGTYVVRYNVASSAPNPVIPAKDGYRSAVSSTFVNVQGGQAATFPTATLDRVTHNVTVTVLHPANDSMSGWLDVKITSTSDPTWQLTPNAAGSNGSNDNTWSFAQVPFGCWSFTIALPTNHYGTITMDSGAGSCASGFEVPGTGTADVTPGFTLNEYQPSVRVNAVKVALDTAPSVVTIKVGPVASPIYTDTAFPVGVSTALPIWLNSSQLVTADAVRGAGWPTNTATVTSAAPAQIITLTELSAKVTVTVHLSGLRLPHNQDATVTLTPPSGSTATAPAAATVTGGANGETTAVFTNIPYGTGWTVDASADVVTAGSPPTTTTSTGSANFDVAAGTAAVTVNMVP
ncbi:MAG: Cna domain protein, partial [Pseudonocardiales bacterium]|nr:Cna domain protein [Pseudonocardiales bacterium]